MQIEVAWWLAHTTNMLKTRPGRSTITEPDASWRGRMSGPVTSQNPTRASWACPAPEGTPAERPGGVRAGEASPREMVAARGGSYRRRRNSDSAALTEAPAKSELGK